MNWLQKVGHKVISSVASDLRDNTLSNAVSIGLGAAKGGQIAYKAATTGFTMLERKVATKTAVGAAKGAGAGWVSGEVVSGIVNKVTGVEKWFDNTRVGKVIDNNITKAELSWMK